MHWSSPAAFALAVGRRGCGVLRQGQQYCSSRSSIAANNIIGGSSAWRGHHSKTTALAESLNFNNDDNDEIVASSSSATEEDLQRWERMYEEGKRQTSSLTRSIMNDGFCDAEAIFEAMTPNDNLNGLQEQQQQQQQTLPPIRVISFDLDNTVWKTGHTISAANDALALYLDKLQQQQQEGEGDDRQPVRRVEKIMGELFQENRARYCPDEDNGSPKGGGPVLLTQLRKDAIQVVLETEFGFDDNDDDNERKATLVDAAFNAWVDARHVAIESHLAEQVVETLSALLQLDSNNIDSNSKVIVGAITDGNSNPTTVECLSGFFDFVVNAEQVGVAKPDRRIYLEAARQVLSRSELDDLLPTTTTTDTETVATLSDDALEEVIGPWWVHVGDDFVKDIVAAKALNMRTIWVKELIQGKVQNVNANADLKSNNGRSVQDFVRDISSQQAAEQEGVVKMQVGAEDYLAQSLEAEFADAAIDRFADLESVLGRWQQESSLMMNVVEDVVATAVAPAAVEEDAQPPSSTSSKEFKFCISCGAKIVQVARFCSECGSKQS